MTQADDLNTKTKAKRTTDAKLKRAADLVIEKGVRVTVGDFVIEPANDGGATITSADAAEAERLQRQMDQSRGR